MQRLLTVSDNAHKLRKKRVGLYLGVEQNAGGMFQYAQCILQSLAVIRDSGTVEVLVVYGDQGWKSIIEQTRLPSKRLQHWIAGGLIAKCLMSFLVPGGLASLLSRWINPLVLEMQKFQCDTWIFPAQDALTWQMDGPVIGTIHDLMHRYERSFPEAGKWWRYYIREHRFRNICRGSSVVLVDSELGRCQVLESYEARPDQVYSLPYIAPCYIHNDVERTDFDTFYHLPAKFYFYPAQFWRHKNHQRLIDALALARETCSDMELVLAGGFRHEYEVIHRKVWQAGLTDVVRFVGYVPDADMAGFYRRARGLVMPTFFGPTNIPPLEAMAAGCPVVISDAYAMPEQCRDAAIYFNPNSFEEMSDQMVRLWIDDRLFEQLSIAGLKRMEAWGQSQFSQRLSEILERVLN